MTKNHTGVWTTQTLIGEKSQLYRLRKELLIHSMTSVMSQEPINKAALADKLQQAMGPGCHRATATVKMSEKDMINDKLAGNRLS